MFIRVVVAAVPILSVLPLALAIPLNEHFVNSTEYHQLQRRADTKACSKLPFEFFIRRSSIDLNVQTGPDDCKLPNSVLGGRGYELPAATVSRQPFEVVKGDNYKTMTNLEVGAVGLGTHTCDHILEIGVVKGVLESTGGVCDVAKTLIDAANGDQTKIDDVKNKLNNIVILLNGPANLVFLQRSVEGIKGDLVNWVRDGRPSNRNPISLRAKTTGKKKKVTTYSGGKGFWLPGGVLDYLFDKTQSVGLAVAGSIDAAITRDFPGAVAGVTFSWQEVYLREMKKELLKIEVAATNAISTSTCDTPGGPSFSRRTTLGTDPGFELYSSLTVRAAAGRVKSGPKAPPGRSCPLKNAPQKQAVPRSQVKTKAKPATKPRVPTTRPQPRPPSPKKQVVPRPANRPRRVAGQPAKQKRTTPKTKPRVVPKPSRRPRGKPRTRRRR